MRTPGERVKWTRLIQSDKYVVAVDVEVVIPAGDPSEPCYEPETIELLDQIQEHADDGDVNWLRQHGTVYEAIGAANEEAISASNQEAISAPNQRPELPTFVADKTSQEEHAEPKHVFRSQIGGRYGLLTHAEKKLGIKTRAIKNRV